MTPICSTVPNRAAPFVKMVNKPNVGVMLDTFHLNIEEVDMAQAILEVRGVYIISM